jgi:hypothetical protein
MTLVVERMHRLRLSFAQGLMRKMGRQNRDDLELSDLAADHDLVLKPGFASQNA